MSPCADIDGRLDPELAAVRARYPSLGFDLNDIVGSRVIMGKMAERARLSDTAPVYVSNITLPEAAETPALKLRILRPSAVHGVLPVLLWMHGGGFVLGSAEDTDRELGELIAETGCVVVCPDYRLAPEHPYPAALDDCARALAWVEEQALAHGLDARRIAIGGASAGAGLAAALALRARDQQLPGPVFQLLIYPMLDDRNASRSSYAIQDAGLWNRETNLRAWDLYLGGRRGRADVSPYAAAARATDLTALPPAFVAVGDLDLFLDEDIDYAQRLLQAGVPTELHVYSGAIHGFDAVAPASAIARRLKADMLGALRRAFGQ